MVAGRQNFRDYYQILGVSPQAPPEEIKQGFRRLAFRYHPDRNPGDTIAEDRFKDINEAHEILSDEGRRSQYDRFRESILAMDKRKPNRSRKRDKGSNLADQDFDRFIENIRNPPDTPRRDRIDPRSPDAYAAPRRTKVERPPTAKSTAPRSTARSSVKSSPKSSTRSTTKPASKPQESYRLERKRDVEARLSLPLEKAFNGGRERIRLEDGRSLEVDMPPGMRDSQKIRLRNQGLNGGDLYLKITVEPHTYFELRGTDVFCQVPITPAEAVLGGSVEVPTLDGLVKMNLPAGVKMGQRLRLAKKGFPNDENQRGDQLVELQIQIPTELTPQEKELYEKLRDVESFAPRQALIS